jgi:hypothetical protein
VFAKKLSGVYFSGWIFYSVHMQDLSREQNDYFEFFSDFFELDLSTNPLNFTANHRDSTS